MRDEQPAPENQSGSANFNNKGDVEIGRDVIGRDQITTNNYYGEQPPVQSEKLPKGDQSPYKGMAYYTEADKDRFFGREAVTTELVTRLTNHQSLTTNHSFLPIIGVSGSGKSSLVRAGIVPALRERGWEIRVIVPTAHPLKSLAAALSNDIRQRRDLIDMMQEGDERVFDLAVQNVHSKGQSFLLVIDQFEELFTTLPKLLDPNDEKEKQQRDAAKRVRQQFVNNIFYALRTSPLTTVIITLRADFLAYCFDYAQLRDALEEKPKLLAAMDREELIRAIRQPAEQLQYTFAEGLVDTILRDCGVVNAGDAADAGVLPLLSHALDQMWEHSDSMALTLEAYEAAGRVQGAIAKTAEATYQALSDSDKAHARHIFLQLTELGEGSKDTRRYMPLTTLLGAGRQRRDLLTNLMNARLITTDKDNFAAVVHEALIREWRQLREWIDEGREALRFQRRISADAHEWQTHDNDPDLLYRGLRLNRTVEWLTDIASSEDFLLEKKFIESSQQIVIEQEQNELRRLREIAEANQRVATETRLRGRRSRQWLALVTILLMIALLLGFLANNRAVTTQNAEATAEMRRVEAETAQSEIRQAKISLGLSLVELAPQQADDEVGENDELATLLALEALRLNRDVGDSELNDHIDGALRPLLTQPHFATIFDEHSLTVWSVAFSPDGNFLASASSDGTIKLWNLHNPDTAPLVLDRHSSLVLSVTFSADGNFLASASADQTVRLWDLHSPKNAPVIFSGHSSLVWSVAFSPDGNSLASASEDQTVRLWDLHNPNADPFVFDGHSDQVRSVAFSPDGSYLASASDDQTVRLWNLNDLDATPHVFDGHSSWVRSVAFSPDGNSLASASDDQTVRLWDLHNPKAPSLIFDGHSGTVLSIAFSPDGNYLASASSDQTVRLWNLNDLDTTPHVFVGHSSWVGSVAFSPDGNSLASASNDQTVRLWNLYNPDAARLVFDGHSNWVRSVAFSSDGNYLASASDDQTVRLWDLHNPKAPSLIFDGHSGMVLSVAFSPDGNYLASASSDQTVRLWNLNNPNTIPLIFNGHSGRVRSVAFSPDGNSLASASDDQTVRLWDLHNPDSTPLVFDEHSDWVRAVAFSPDGNLLASASDDQTIRLWDLNSPNIPPTVFDEHSSLVWSVAFSPDGTSLATSNSDQTVRLWDLHNLDAAPIVFDGHSARIWSVAFSPDGNSLVSASDDQTMRLWDLHNPDADPIIFDGYSALLSVAFSPDGNSLASANSDQTISLWVISLEKLERIACSLVRRNLTWAEWRQFLPTEETYNQTCPNLKIAEDVPEGARR